MPSRARSNRASATKSRSDTASSELSNRAEKPSSARHPVRVQGQRRAGQGAGTQGGDVEAPAGGGEAVDVAGQGPAVGQQVVGQEDRLGPLQVGVAGKVGVPRFARPGQQHLLQGDDALGHLAQRPSW